MIVSRSKRDCIRERINILISYWVQLDKPVNNPFEVNSIYWNQQDVREGMVFLECEIEELMNSYFEVKKEAATGQGDYNLGSITNIDISIISSRELGFKEEIEYADNA